MKFLSVKLFVCALLGLGALIGGVVRCQAAAFPASITVSGASGYNAALNGVYKRSATPDPSGSYSYRSSGAYVIFYPAKPYGYRPGSSTPRWDMRDNAGGGSSNNPSEDGTAFPMTGWYGVTVTQPTAAVVAGDVFTPSPSPFSGVIASVGGFVRGLVTNYGIPAILVAMCVMGWFLLKQFAQSTVH